MQVTCSYCKTVADAAEMNLSTFTGKSWCIDQDACRRRLDLTIRRKGALVERDA